MYETEQALDDRGCYSPINRIHEIQPRRYTTYIYVYLTITHSYLNIVLLHTTIYTHCINAILYYTIVIIIIIFFYF